MDFTPSRRIRSQISRTGTKFKEEFEIQSIPVFASLKRYPEHRRLATYKFQGFYEPELVNDRYQAWSGAESVIRCSFYVMTSIRHIWLEVAGTSPLGSHVDIYLDGRLLTKQKKLKGRSTLRLSLPENTVTDGLALKIVTNTFTPGEIDPQSEDHRNLGIAIRGLAFAKRRYRYSSGMCFKKPLSHKVMKAWNSVFGRAA
ncbi:MAG: hypothetical protein GY768_11520 [Planctomycetaceae bacterium]|nr:hypothetical protein [Planctomycetaceae bacterium]